MALIYLGLGSNLGDKAANLNEAILQIREKVGTVLKQSSFHASEAWGYLSENEFLNAAVLVDTVLNPFDLLRTTQEIEKTMGRQHKTVNEYADRIIDIDILFYDREIIDCETLKIPHPLIPVRQFVVAPLTEIAPDFVHPVEGKTIKEFLCA